MIPENITKEHIEKAINEIDEKGIRKRRHSSTYDLLYKGNLYPPKLVISIANKYANGEELDPNKFEGGEGKPAFILLEKEGFIISKKNNPFVELIDAYKKHITGTKLEDELYKWELIEEYKGRPDTKVQDFHQEIKSIKFLNLLYAMSIAVIQRLSKEKPEELRGLFNYLFDESIDLKQRIQYFNIESLKLYRSFGAKLSHHQDERSMATYLTFHNPDLYTFYKASFYSKLCKLLNINEAKKNEKYVHYLSLINSFIKDYIIKDSSLIELVRATIPEHYNGSNNLLLAQDILYQMLEKKEEINYWIFQGNPKIYDIVGSLKDKALKTWSVKNHKTKIKSGDKIILWVTGDKQGCYALGEAVSEIYEGYDDESEERYYIGKRNNELTTQVKIKITHNLYSDPITKEQINETKELSGLKVGNQGTNFSATKEQYQKLLQMSKNDNKKYWMYAPGTNAEKWDEFYNEGIMGLGWEKLGDLNDFASKKDIESKLQMIENTDKSKRNDATANYEFKEDISIGDIIFVKKGRSQLLGYGEVTSDYYHDENRSNFKNCRKVEWKKKGSWNTDHTLVLKTLTNVTNYPSEHPDFDNYYDRLFWLINVQQNVESDDNKDLHLDKNTILYGPPGTGKTYQLKNNYLKYFVSKQNSVSREEYIKSILQDCSWWQVIALVLLEIGQTKVSDIYNHPYVQIKSGLSNSTTVPQTIWGQLQSHTIDSCEFVNVKIRRSPLIFNKTKNSKWEILDNEVEEQSPDIIELKEKINDFKNIPNIEIKRYNFVTFHQSFSYEDFVEGIKPVINDESESQVSYKIEDGVFKKLCNRARNDLDNNYALFIDEINRGNVSSIFGELITLIEDDKREGMPNAISVILPYSKVEFSVPPNIHIIGTMNTADRSVEALDTALRRRFSFIEMAPLPELVKTEGILKDTGGVLEGIDLCELLNTINKRIEKLVDKDHMIGHSYFLTVSTIEDLKFTFQHKIIPLLQEYFFGDNGKMGLVIGSGFLIEANNDVEDDFFAEFDSYDAGSLIEKPVYHLKDIVMMTDEEFVGNINALLRR